MCLSAVQKTFSACCETVLIEEAAPLGVNVLLLGLLKLKKMVFDSNGMQHMGQKMIPPRSLYTGVLSHNVFIYCTFQWYVWVRVMLGVFEHLHETFYLVGTNRFISLLQVCYDLGTFYFQQGPSNPVNYELAREHFFNTKQLVSKVRL